MAKDGTARGGRRPRSGPQKENESINMATLVSRISELPVPDELEADYIPELPEFMTEVQKDGSTTDAEKVFKKLYVWLHSLDCDKTVPQDLIERYSQSVGRWIQAERMISKHGLLAMHPTVKSPIASPLVTISFGYLKQAENLWYDIYQIVKESAGDIGSAGAGDSLMESLLRNKL